MSVKIPATAAARVRDAERIRHAVLDDYRRRTPGSAALARRAARSLAGGTTGNLRHFHPYPLYFREGSGSTLTDVDGHRYIDCFLANGPLLLGHRHPAILAAQSRHAMLGSLVVNPPLAVELAEQIQQTVACAQRVRFLNSGTEAVLTAVRLARAYTGRSKVVKFLGHYHGQDDQFLVGLDASGSVFGAGIPREALANTLLCRCGSGDALLELLARESDVAAVIVDPAMHSGGLWGCDTAYLRVLREITTGRNIVLIFDEVITGYRLALGGAQSLHGVTPELATFGKALGAGEKLAAVVGCEELMRGLDPGRGPGVPGVFQSGTGNDATSALAAGLAAVTTYRGLDAEGAYGVLGRRAERLAEGLRAAFAERSIPGHVQQLGPMLQLFFSESRPRFEALPRLPAEPLALFYLALINEGILLSLPTSNHIYLSFCHTDSDIQLILEKAATVLDRYDFGTLARAASDRA